jgi:hypothetical protein
MKISNGLKGPEYYLEKKKVKFMKVGKKPVI